MGSIRSGGGDDTVTGRPASLGTGQTWGFTVDGGEGDDVIRTQLDAHVVIAIYDGALADYTLTADEVGGFVLVKDNRDGSEDTVRNVEVLAFGDQDVLVELL